MTDYEYENENAHLVLLVEQAGVVFGIRLNILSPVSASVETDVVKMQAPDEESTS